MHVLFALLLLCLVPCAADADDRQPQRATTPWQGFYLGLSAGAANLDAAYDNSNPRNETTAHLEHDGSAAAFGFHAGYLMPLGPLVLGAELAYVHSQIESTTHYVVNEGNPGHDAGFEQDHTLMLTGRVGLPHGSILPYIKAGFALTHINMTVGANGVTSNADLANTGFEPALVYGGGIELHVGPALSLALDWTRLDLDAGGARTYNSDVGTAALNLDGHTDLIMLQLSYHPN